MPEGFRRWSPPDCWVKEHYNYVAQAVRSEVCEAHNAAIFTADLVIDEVSDFEPHHWGIRRNDQNAVHDFPFV
jgi:hypothetical protein